MALDFFLAENLLAEGASASSILLRRWFLVFISENLCEYLLAFTKNILLDVLMDHFLALPWETLK